MSSYAASTVTKLWKQRDKVAAKVAERDERIVEAQRSAEDDRMDISAVSEELVALYSDPEELLKHARVIDMNEIEENEFNLNVPRYRRYLRAGTADRSAGRHRSAQEGPNSGPMKRRTNSGGY